MELKIAFIIVVVSVSNVLAIPTYSQVAKVSLDMKNRSIEQVMDEIERQSEFYFIFNQKQIDVNRFVDIQAENKLITDILPELFNGTNVNYVVFDQKILLTTDPMENNLLALASGIELQQKQITGNVTDEKGNPLPGVNVSIKGTTLGTLTNASGKYAINDVPLNAIMIFSFVGMETQEIPSEGRVQIDVVLKETSVGLDEVVVVGYGTQKKVNVVGSISQISSSEFEGRSVPLLSNALTGQMTGVSVITRSGAPGTSTGTIRVRGVGSFGATPDALVLVDGIPGNINDVRPEEVESISVLKDASSAAIYGARAANGVILVTTKAGKSARVKVNYNGYGGFVTPTTLPEFLNSWDYALAYNEASGTTLYSASDIEKFKDGRDPVNFPNSRMLNEIFSRNGFQTGHDLTFNGGTDITQYYLSFGYLSQDGVVDKNNFTRYSVRLNMNSMLTTKLKITTRLSGVSSLVKEPAVPGGKDAYRMDDGIIQIAARYPSIYATKLPNGDYGIGPESMGTPLAWISSPSFSNSPTWKFGGKMNLEYKPFKDLVFSAMGGYNFTFFESKLYRSTMRLNDNLTMGPSSLVQTDERTQFQTLQATANYNKKIADHTFSVLFGYSFEKQGYRDISGYRDKFPGNDLPYIDAGSPDNQQATGGGYDWALQSIFGRLTYNYKEKYLFETTLRNDGSSKFPPTKKYGLFPSVAAGWRISEEPFLKDKLGPVSNLKLKASWGKLGNQNIGNYPWQSSYQLGQDYVFGGVFTQGAAMTTLSDPNLRWESTQTTDGGIESSFWNGKLNLNVSYFYRKTIDILYKPTSSVSTVLGMNLSEMNTGSLENSGLEIELGHQNTIGHFNYQINANFTLIQNKVLDLGVGNVNQPNGLVGNGTDLFIGYPMQLYYGLATDGVFLDQADIDAWYALYDQSSISPLASAKPGDFRYVDLSGDGKVDISADRKVLGSQIPKYNFSFNFSCDYKGFDFSAMLQGVAGVNGLLNNYSGFAFYNLGSIQEWMWKGRFDPANPTRYPDYPRLQILGNAAGVNGQLSDFWVLDASYLRVKNLQLGYSFSAKILKTFHVDGIRIYASAENPVTLDHYRKGWDPEINTSGTFYPVLTSYTFGINLKF